MKRHDFNFKAFGFSVSGTGYGAAIAGVIALLIVGAWIIS